jgi:hypothetical protein
MRVAVSEAHPSALPSSRSTSKPQQHRPPVFIARSSTDACWHVHYLWDKQARNDNAQLCSVADLQLLCCMYLTMQGCPRFAHNIRTESGMHGRHAIGGLPTMQSEDQRHE